MGQDAEPVNTLGAAAGASAGSSSPNPRFREAGLIYRWASEVLLDALKPTVVSTGHGFAAIRQRASETLPIPAGKTRLIPHVRCWLQSGRLFPLSWSSRSPAAYTCGPATFARPQGSYKQKKR